jgi:hypothetical protein
MKVANGKTTELKNRFYYETRKYLLLTVYIAMILSGLKIYERMILVEYHISYFHLGYGLFESMVLAKIILLGDFLGLGERFGGKPLILKILYKAFAISILALFLSILEYAIEGFLHSWDIAGAFQGVMIKGGGQILAHTLIMFINFIPLFAIWEIGRAMGGNRVFELLFKRQFAVSSNVLKIHSTNINGD